MEKVPSFKENISSLNTNTTFISNKVQPSLYHIPIFLSYATPYNELQMVFLDRIVEEIKSMLLFPRTLGVTDQDTETPLTAIRRIILSSYGLLAVAFRRTLIEKAVSRPNAPREQVYTSQWLTSPYLQIEPAMAYQEGLPLMMIVEERIINDGVFGGILEKGAAPLFISRFSLKNREEINNFFNSVQWKGIFLDWIGQVRAKYECVTSKAISPENSADC